MVVRGDEGEGEGEVGDEGEVVCITCVVCSLESMTHSCRQVFRLPRTCMRIRIRFSCAHPRLLPTTSPTCAPWRSSRLRIDIQANLQSTPHPSILVRRSRQQVPYKRKLVRKCFSTMPKHTMKAA